MDTIAIDRVERAGQVLLIEPPFVFRVRQTTVTSGDDIFPMWKADLMGEHPLDMIGAGVDPAKLRPPAGATVWWGPAQRLSLQTLTVTTEELPEAIAQQLWFWWDNLVMVDDALLTPENRAAARYLRVHLRLA